MIKCLVVRKKELYANAVGSLMYVLVCTRAEIGHAVGVVNRYMENPGREHWNVLKLVLQYAQVIPLTVIVTHLWLC